jgi:hypothetical protein
MRIVLKSFAGAAILALAGCNSGIPAEATVTLIDRTCTIITSEKSQVPIPGSSQTREVTTKIEQSKGECKSVDEWETIRKKRTKDVDGTAVVHVEYQAPQDGRIHQSTLQFDGRDDEFYDLRAGDHIKIKIAEGDPERIRRA